MQQIADARAGAQNSTSNPPRPRLRRLAAALASISIGAAALFGAATPAAAHDELVGIAGELNDEQTRIDLILSFNNEVMDVGAEAVVTGADGADLADGEPSISGRDVTQRIVMPGFDETITVAWRVVSSDGHPISGMLAFAVLEHDDGTEIEFRDVESGDEDHADHEHDHADHDHADHDHDHEGAGGSPVTTTNSDSSGMPVGGWIAIGVGAAFVVSGITWWATAKRRK